MGTDSKAALHHFSLRKWVLVGVGVLAGTTCAAHAGDLGGSAPPILPAAGKVVWRCWHDVGQRLACRLASNAPAVPPAHLLKDKQPGLVDMIRLSPERLRGRLVHIPLISDPLDMDLVHELATEILCGANRQCQVDLVAGREELAQAQGD